uniref:Macro domain-containing protein n=1 Tax=Caenorhabditis tropicalis TaxID=1561998 RepID=A0A1I7U5B5_9PELO
MDSDNNDAVSDSEDNSQFNVADDSQQSLGMVESSQNSSRKRDILKARKERDSKSKAARRLIDSQQDRQVDAVGNPNVKPRSDAVSRRSLSQKRRDASRKAKRRSEETEADKIVRKHKNAAQMSARRSEEPDDVRAQRNMSDAERKMRARSEEPDDVREKRNSTNAKRTAVKRSEELPETKRKRNVSNANRMSSKRSKDAEYSSDFSVLKSNSIHGNTQKPKCKIRISFVDLLDLETQCIVIPHYGSVNQVDRSAIYNQYWKRLEDGREDYKEFLDSLDLKEFTPEVYPCEGRNQFHIQAPVMDKSGFTLVTETALRATYLSCLHRADLNGSRSIGFPILGKGISRRMSVALALQTFFAYFNSSPSRNIQLVYLVTKNMDECDDIASFTSYIREIDFSQWTIQQEMHILYDPWNRIHLESSVFWIYESKEKVESDSAQNIHDIMCEKTGVSMTAFKFYDESSGNGRQRIRDYSMAEIQLNEESPENIINFLYPIENVCGSNAILRKLWIVSSYIMFYGNRTDILGRIPLSEDSAEFTWRKNLFNLLKNLHREVLKQWNRVVKYVPKKCDCLKLRGYHEQLYFFTTPLSHPDPIFEQFVLNGKTLMVKESSIHDVQNLQYKFVPGVPSSAYGYTHEMIVLGVVKSTNMYWMMYYCGLELMMGALD